MFFLFMIIINIVPNEVTQKSKLIKKSQCTGIKYNRLLNYIIYSYLSYKLNMTC